MSYRYVGSELELFAGAVNWKAYVAAALGRFMTGRVLEIGAGIGSNIPCLYSRDVGEWTSLEPDAHLSRHIGQRLREGKLPGSCRVVTGTIECLGHDARFDTILYLDVLEHIDADRAELAAAARLLSPGGHLVVLAPAHPFLFSTFDAAVGHYRRYAPASLRALMPPGCRLEACLMLDCAGFFASLGNRLMLSSMLPSPRQIAIWDKLLVPISRRLDPVIGYKFGKTVVAIWRRASAETRPPVAAGHPLGGSVKGD